MLCCFRLLSSGVLTRPVKRASVGGRGSGKQEVVRWERGCVSNGVTVNQQAGAQKPGTQSLGHDTCGKEFMGHALGMRTREGG